MFEWITTWIYGSDWNVTIGKQSWVIHEHRSGIICHLHALFLSWWDFRPTGAHANFTTTNWNHKTWIYGK